MASASLFPRAISGLTGLAIALLLLLALPGHSAVQIASAQGGTTNCPNGQIVAVGQACPTFTGFNGNTCGSVSVSCSSNNAGCGTSFNGSSLLGCSGNFNGGCSTSVAGGASCASTGCGGSQLFGGSSSGLFGGGGCLGGGGGGCVGRVLQAGQSCSNGVISGTATSSTAGVTAATSLAATALNRSSTPLTCPGGGFAVGGVCGSAAVTSAALPVSTGSTSTSLSPGAGFTVSLAQGWNIVAGPSGTTLPTSAFTWQAGDTSYETVAPGSPLKGGAGYWVNMLAAGQITIANGPSSSMTVTIPAGGQVMIGNPGNTVATVTGADSVVTYNAGTSSWTPTTQLQPGQGAWAASAAGATVTITNAPVPGG